MREREKKVGGGKKRGFFVCFRISEVGRKKKKKPQKGKKPLLSFGGQGRGWRKKVSTQPGEKVGGRREEEGRLKKKKKKKPGNRTFPHNKLKEKKGGEKKEKRIPVAAASPSLCLGENGKEKKKKKLKKEKIEFLAL